jgi:hypothetical protein
MTSQATNRRKGGRGRSWKPHAMPELRKSYVETVRVAQKLLGVLTIGGGSARAGGGGGGSQRSQIRPHASWKRQFHSVFGL